MVVSLIRAVDRAATLGILPFHQCRIQCHAKRQHKITSEEMEFSVSKAG